MGRPQNREERLLHPDIDHARHSKYLFYCPQIGVTFDYLPYLRPSAFYMFGGKSIMSTGEVQAEEVKRTGTGLGGSGGVAAGQVRKQLFEDWGHMFPCEHVATTARVAGKWLGEQLRQFEVDERFLKDHPSGKSDRDMLIVSEQWMKLVRGPGSALRSSTKEKL